ncbi:MAG: hypothetical protein ACHQAV_01335 [Solirubrobacterales bacterium]
MATGGWTISSTRFALGSPRAVVKPGGTPRALPGSRSLAAAFDPADLRERLRKIRPVAPTFEQELEIARRQATRLCAQNRRVLEEVRRLQKQRGGVGARKDRRRA